MANADAAAVATMTEPTPSLVETNPVLADLKAVLRSFESTSSDQWLIVKTIKALADRDGEPPAPLTKAQAAAAARWDLQVARYRDELVGLEVEVERAVESFGELKNWPAAVEEFSGDPEVVRLIYGGRLDKAALDALSDVIKADLDSISEMSQVHLLRLQMAMDRLSKLMATLSNIRKKL